MAEKTIPAARPRARTLRALLALNAVLLGVLAAVTFGPAAGAQARSRGAYAMVAGGAPNLQSSLVYIVDVVNQELMVVSYSGATRSLNGVAYRNLAADAADALRSRPRAGP